MMLYKKYNIPLSFYCNCHFLAYAIVSVSVDRAFAFGFCGDLAALAYCGDLLVGCHVAQRGRMALWHQLLFLVDFVHLGLDFECLALLESQFAFLDVL